MMGGGVTYTIKPSDIEHETNLSYFDSGVDACNQAWKVRCD